MQRLLVIAHGFEVSILENIHYILNLLMSLNTRVLTIFLPIKYFEYMLGNPTLFFKMANDEISSLF